MSMLYGAVAATYENETAIFNLPVNFMKNVTEQERAISFMDFMRDLSSNTLAFEIGRLIGDLASVYGGFHLALGGFGILAAAGVSGQIEITPAGIAILAEGTIQDKWRYRHSIRYEAVSLSLRKLLRVW